MNTTIIDHCDVAAYRSWTDRRSAPAYLRGIPSWVWQSARYAAGGNAAQPPQIDPERTSSGDAALDSANHLLLEDDSAWPRFLAEIDAFIIELP